VHERIEATCPPGKAVPEGALSHFVKAIGDHRDPVRRFNLKLWRRLINSADTPVLGPQHVHRVLRIMRIADLHTVDEKHRDPVQSPCLAASSRHSLTLVGAHDPHRNPVAVMPSPSI
jgi:hypothetical protein